jgi:hypothetical protein
MLTPLDFFGSRRKKIVLYVGDYDLSSAATCPSCHAYAAFSLKARGSPQVAPDASQRFAPQRLRVSCDKCAHEWTIVPLSMALATDAAIFLA